MELFKVFSNDIKLKTLFAPLKHPNIKYEWVEKNIHIDNQLEKIIFIGEIIDDGNVDIIESNGIKIGFYDHNKNLVTTVLFHDLNLKKPGYQKLYHELQHKKLKEKEDEIKDLKIDNKTEELIKDLDKDVRFYMDIIAYIRTGNFKFDYEISYSKVEIDKLVSIIKEKGEKLSLEYPHLKLMINILLT